MMTAIERIFSEKGVEYFGVLPFSECSVINKQKINKLDFEPKTVFPFLIPYYSGEYSERNLSLYALSKDYHLFFKEFSEQLITELEAAFSENRFAAFADNSPIDEREASAKASLGVIGLNGMLINERYSSFVFLGEIISDIEFSQLSKQTEFKILTCEGCRLCLEACPKKDVCLSALTQKKGELSKEEENEILALGSVWGCDICQTVCPHSKNVSLTPFEFFKTDITPFLSEKLLEEMSDEDFSKRAYSWRGRKTVARNIAIFEGKDKS